MFSKVALIIASAQAQDCFKQDEVNAAANLPWQVENVDGNLVTTKPEVITGLQISDLSFLQNNDNYEAGKMKIAKLEWCTERELNQGRLVYLRSNVKPLQDYRSQDFVALNDIGTRSDYCQDIRFDSE